MKPAKSILFAGGLIALLLFCSSSQTATAQSVTARGFGKVAGGGKNDAPVAGRSDGSNSTAPGNKTGSGLDATTRDSLERRVFKLINQKRAEMNLAPLAWSDEIAKVARLHSDNMVRFGFFSHAGPGGSMVDDRAETLGLSKWRAIGENIAYNRGFQDPVETAVEKWMLSDTHRENLLSARWRETGIGIAVRPDGAYFFTQVFLTR